MAGVDSEKQIAERLAVNETRPREIDILTKVLRVAENDPNLWVADFVIDDAVGKCENHLSSVQRANVTARRSNGSYLKKSFVMKVQVQDEEKKAALKMTEVWAVEEFVYNYILPTLSKISKEQMPHPKFYFSDPNVIILEDLSVSGYKMGERLIGLDKDHTVLVMEAFAQMHAASLAMQHKDPTEYEMLRKTFHHPYDGDSHLSAIMPYVKTALLQTVDMIKSEDKEKKYESMVAYMSNVAQDPKKYIMSLIPSRDDDALVIVHGDAWVNNFLFSYDKTTKKPVDLKFIDFQLTKMSSPTVDLFHFLYTSVEPKVRRKYFDSFIQHYHQCFYDNLLKFTGDAEYTKKYSFDWFYNEMEKYRVYGLLNAALALPAVCAPKDGAFDFLKMDKNNNTMKYTERLFGVLDEYIENEWFHTLP